MSCAEIRTAHAKGTAERYSTVANGAGTLTGKYRRETYKAVIPKYDSGGQPELLSKVEAKERNERVRRNICL